MVIAIYYLINRYSLKYKVESEIESALSSPGAIVCLERTSEKIYSKLSELQSPYSLNKLFIEDSLIYATERNIDCALGNKELFLKPISKIYPITDDVNTLTIGNVDLTVVGNTQCGKLWQIQRIIYLGMFDGDEEQLDIEYRPMKDNDYNAAYCRTYQVVKDELHRNWDNYDNKRISDKRYCYKNNEDITVNESSWNKHDAMTSLQVANILKNITLNMMLKLQAQSEKPQYSCVVHIDSITLKWNRWLAMVSENERWNDLSYAKLLDAVNNNTIKLLVTCSSFNGSDVEVRHVIPLVGIDKCEQRTLNDFENYIQYLVRTNSEFTPPVLNGKKANLFKTIIITINKGSITSVEY